MWRVIASAVIDGDIAFVPYGRGEYLAGIRLGGSGDVTATESPLGKARAAVSVPKCRRRSSAMD